jgi:hypothetical protein
MSEPLVIVGNGMAAARLCEELARRDLYAEGATEKQLLSSDSVSIDLHAVDSAAQFVRDYLSREHFEDIDGTCSVSARSTVFGKHLNRAQGHDRYF